MQETHYNIRLSPVEETEWEWGMEKKSGINKWGFLQNNDDTMY